MLKIPKTFVILKIIEKGQEVHMRGKFWKEDAQRPAGIADDIYGSARDCGSRGKRGRNAGDLRGRQKFLFAVRRRMQTRRTM